MKAARITLKACPFCGGQPVIWPGHVVQCPAEGCEVKTLSFSSDQEAADNWNRRVLPTDAEQAIIGAYHVLAGEALSKNSLVMALKKLGDVMVDYELADRRKPNVE